jgi:hypothetical protein
VPGAGVVRHRRRQVVPVRNREGRGTGARAMRRGRGMRRQVDAGSADTVHGARGR